MSNVDKLEAVMSKAYKKWEGKSWSYEDFLMELDANERDVVVIGNLNYQVCNGGFSQWAGNDYDEGIVFLERALGKINTKEAKRASEMARTVTDMKSGAEKGSGYDGWGDDMSEREQDVDYETCNEFDNEFYKFNELLLEQAQEVLV